METVKTEAAAVAEIVCASLAVKQIENPLAEQLLVFPNERMKSLEEYAERPRRKRGNIIVNDQSSFAEYVKAHRIPRATALFGRVNEEGGSFSGLIDYHETVTDSGDMDLGKPGWAQHRVSFTLAFTPEWKRWTGNNDKMIAQATFADFIEDNLYDIIDPASADLLEIVQELVAKSSVDFKSGIRLTNGQQKLVYDEVITATGGRAERNMEVPSEFTIRVAPFVGSEPVEIKARLRFRIQEKRLFFVYKLNAPHKVIEDAFTAARDFIATSTGIPVLLGEVKHAGI